MPQSQSHQRTVFFVSDGTGKPWKIKVRPPCFTQFAAYADLIEQVAAASKIVKDAQKALNTKVAARYAQLTEAEIKTLVVDDKWLATIAAAVQGELDRVSQTLTGRIRQLAERYATPLPKLTDEVATLAARVDEHLKKMGAVWK